MASKEQSLSPSMGKLLQDCLVKLEQIDMFTCEICDTMYGDEESLTRHLATHMTRDDTVIYKECASRIEPRHKTSHIKLSENNVIKTETRHKQSIRDRIIFDSDSDEGTLKTEVSDENMSFVSEGDTLSTSDYPLFSASNNDNLGTLNVEEMVNSSRELADDIRNKVNESTSNSVSANNIQSYGRLIPCNMCDMYFAHKSSLKIHKLTHQKKVVVTRAIEGSRDKPTQKVELFACDLCQKQFPKKKYLAKHINYIHHLKKSWKCKFCDKKFKIKVDMQRHERIHTNEKPYSCNKCNIFFKNYSSYSFHRRNVHTKEKPVCEICDRQFSEKSGLKRHILSVHMTTGYPCSICNKEFGHSRARASHMIVHRKTFLCSCGKSFPNKSDLMMHEALHKKAFECHYCNMKFGKKWHVERHIKNSCKKVPKLHQNFYECSVCHMKTARKDYLAVHLKICKLRPHNCPKCRLRFADISSLNGHQNRCHQSK